MAARENQGLQIALIIFVMLTIVLIVFTFLFFSYYKEAQEKIVTLTNDNAQKDTASRKAIEDSTTIKGLLDPKLEQLEALQEASNKDFAAHGKGLADADRNYRNLVAHLVKELAAANTRITTITAHEKELVDKIAADETAKKAEVEKYTQTIATTTKDLEDERKKFAEFRDKISQENADLNKKSEDTRKRYDDLTKTSGEEITALKTENTKLNTAITNIHNREQRDEKANEVPDGKIYWVNQRNRTAYIDVGSEDGLRLQTSFSVYPHTTTNPADAQQKGKLEIISLKGPHMAEATIVEDDVSDPLMPGDKIFSPTWEPGRAEHFALAGFMDIDGDGTSDRKRVRELITMNGGVIDAEIGDDGTKTGELSAGTKYLVRGEQPKPVEGSSTLTGWSEINKDAQTLGTKTMDIHELLNYMGHKVQDRTVPLGANARSNDFKPRLPEGVQRVRPGSERVEDLRRPLPTVRDR